MLLLRRLYCDAALTPRVHTNGLLPKPILALTDEMVGKGFVRSLSKPGGNTTGVTILASELDGQWQETLIESVPGVQRIAVLADH